MKIWPSINLMSPYKQMKLVKLLLFMAYLDKQILHQRFVSSLIVLQFLSHLLLHGLFKGINVLVHFAHFVDSSHILLF